MACVRHQIGIRVHHWQLSCRANDKDLGDSVQAFGAARSPVQPKSCGDGSACSTAATQACAGLAVGRDKYTWLDLQLILHILKYCLAQPLRRAPMVQGCCGVCGNSLKSLPCKLRTISLLGTATAALGISNRLIILISAIRLGLFTGCRRGSQHGLQHWLKPSTLLDNQGGGYQHYDLLCTPDC